MVKILLRVVLLFPILAGLVTGFAGAQQPAQPPVLPPPQPLPNAVADPANQPIETVEFRALPLIDAMRLLSQQTGVKIVPSAKAAETKVSLYLENVTPLEVVQAITRANGLVYKRDMASGIIRIMTPKELDQDLTSFREEHTEVFTLLYPNAVNTATAIRDLFGSTRVQLGYGASDQFALQDLEQRLARFNVLYQLSLGLGIPQSGTGSVGGTGGTTTGGTGGVGSTGAGGAGGGGLTRGGTTGGFSGTPFQNTNQNIAQGPQRNQILTPGNLDLTPEEIQRLEDSFLNKEAPDRTFLLELLRRRPATIFVTVVKEHNQLIVRTADEKTLQEIRDLVCRLDVPTPVVLLEVKILSINLGDTFNSIFDYQFTNAVLSAGSFTTGNILPPSADADPSSARRYETIAPGPNGTNPTNNLLFQVVSANFRARLQLLESKNRVTELATPLLMTANNEVSQVFTGVQQPITIGFTPSTSTVTATGPAITVPPTPITSLEQIGTSLVITPNINADRSVTLRILQESSSINTGGGNIPFINADGSQTTVTVDTVNQQFVSGTIVAQDGLTIALGGLIQESLADQRSEVPVLGKIPYLGFFFRRQNTMRSRTELVVMIRPFVLTTPCESGKTSQMLLENLSIHPNVPQGGLGTLGTYVPAEVLRANPPRNELQNIFRVHTILPKDF